MGAAFPGLCADHPVKMVSQARGEAIADRAYGASGARRESQFVQLWHEPGRCDGVLATGAGGRCRSDPRHYAVVRKNREIWGVAGGFLFQREGERLTLSTGYFFQQWVHFLERNCALVLAHGGSLPIHVRLGISNLTDSWWPQGPFSFRDEGYAAVELAYEYDGRLTSIEPEAVKAVAVSAFNGLAAVYGQEPFTFDEIIELSKR